MGILAHGVERARSTTGPQGLLGSAGRQLQLAEPQQGAKSQLRQPLALGSQPLTPALPADRQIIDQRTTIESARRAQRLAAALADQGLEPADIALHDYRIQPNRLAVALQRALADYSAQPGKG